MKRPFPTSKSVKRLKLENEIFSKTINDIKLMFNDDFNEINNEKWFYSDIKKDSAYPQISYSYTVDKYNAISHQNTPRAANFSYEPNKHIRQLKDDSPTICPEKLSYDFINPSFLEDDNCVGNRPSPKVVLKSSSTNDLTSSTHLNFDEEADDFFFTEVNLENDLQLIDRIIANAS